MGNRIARDFCRVHRRVRGVCGECAERTERRQRAWFGFWSDRIRVHDFCGAAWGAKTRACLEDWSGASVDARALVAGIAELAGDFISWGISFWRDAHQRIDVAADYYGCERPVRGGAATLRAARDDDRRQAGNDLRRNRKCAETAARRGGSRRGGVLGSARNGQTGEGGGS